MVDWNPGNLALLLIVAATVFVVGYLVYAKLERIRKKRK